MATKRRRKALAFSKVRAEVDDAVYLKPIVWVNRPSGQSEDDYPGWVKWSWRRFAWEFLRRSPDFQHAANGGIP